MSLICPYPGCGQSFSDEEFCPVHFVRLVPPPVTSPEPKPVETPPEGEIPQPGPAAAGASGADFPSGAADTRVEAESGSARSDQPQPTAESSAATTAPATEDTRGHAARDPDGSQHGAPGAGGTRGADSASSTADTSQDEDSRLNRFMNRFRLHRKANGGAQDQAEPAPRQAPPGPGRAAPPSSPLPKALVEQGWRLAGPVESDAAVDRWPVTRDPGGSTPAVRGHFHRYRTGALTSPALYRRLEAEGGAIPGLARVWSQGTVEFGGARADYELVSLPIAGSGLHAWLAETSPTEQRAWNLLTGLVGLLRDLAKAGLTPLAFEPAQLMLTTEGALWLTTAATLTEANTAGVFRPDFERSALLSRGWSAPELTQQSLASSNAALFSLGQVLATAVWGQPCALAEVQVGAVPFQSLADGRLARIMMGCLWPRPSERWSRDDLLLALACAHAEAMPAAPPWASLTPDAASSAFSFAGRAYWRLEDLLATAVLPAHWEEARSQLEAILAWAQGTAWAGQAKVMREALNLGRSLDWVLVALNRVVRPDAPLTWMTLDLSDEEAARSLVSLAQGALRGDQADADLLRALFQADLRGAFRPTRPPPP